MAKLLVFLLVLFGIYLFRRALVRPSNPARGKESARPGPPPPERMIECAHCGLHVPESEAVAGAMADEGLSFCCEAHRRAHRQAPGARG